jgi:hypothetical protein
MRDQYRATDQTEQAAKPAKRRIRTCGPRAGDRDLRHEVQEYAAFGHRGEPVRTRGFPKALIHALDAVAAKTSPRRSRNDVAAWCVVEGPQMLLKFFGFEAIRAAHDTVLATGDTLRLDFFLKDAWFTVELGDVHPKPFRVRVTETEQKGLTALQSLVGLEVRRTLPLAICAGLVGHPDVPDEARDEMFRELKRFKDGLFDRALKAMEYAEAAQPTRKVVGRKVRFEDLL